MAWGRRMPSGGWASSGVPWSMAWGIGAEIVVGVVLVVTGGVPLGMPPFSIGMGEGYGLQLFEGVWISD